MRAMLLTPLEADIIDTLRLSPVRERLAVLIALKLPMPREEYEAHIAAGMMCDNPMFQQARQQRIAEEQAERLRIYKMRGYGKEVDFATEPFEI